MLDEEEEAAADETAKARLDSLAALERAVLSPGAEQSGEAKGPCSSGNETRRTCALNLRSH